MTASSTETGGIVLTEAAASKVQSLVAAEGSSDLVLRISVAPGGCSGLRYQLALDDQQGSDGVVAEHFGTKVITDKMSFPYLMGATIDFVDTISQQGFTIDNPNASNSCACGDSFQ